MAAEAEIAEAVDDVLALVFLHAAEHMGVMAQNHIRAAVNGRLGEFLRKFRMVVVILPAHMLGNDQQITVLFGLFTGLFDL